MNYLIDPQNLVFSAKSRISGFSDMIRDEEIPQWDLLSIAQHIAEEWSYDWPEDEGFGSSDRTYMLKDFIDKVIWAQTKPGLYMTTFNPSLSVVEYSEAEHHNKVQRVESGI